MISKKSQGLGTQTIIGIIILILSFVFLLSYIVDTQEIITDKVQNDVCRATIEIRSNAAVNVGDEISKRTNIDSFINLINDKCLVERINIESSKEEEVFEEVSESMARCWYRYGEGEKDFLSSFQTTGNWCFLCGTVEFEEEFNSEYTDFIEWTEDEKDAIYEKKEGKIITYSEYLDLRYTNITTQEIIDIESDLKEILSEKDPILTGMASLVSNQLEILQDMKIKSISSESEPLYLVYRYNRVDKTLTEQMQDASTGALIGGGASLVTAIIVESVVMGAGSSVVCSVVPVVGNVACGLAGTLTKFVQKTFQSIRIISKAEKRLEKLLFISQKIAKSIKKSKKVKRVLATTVAGTVVGGTISAQINTNHDQYIDIMSKEQYHRLCGTERRVSERLSS